MTIKILSGWTLAGGSTTAFINLTNAFNDKNIDCTFYGIHNWHLNKCKSGLLQDMKLEEDDHLIIHYFNTNWIQRPPIKGKFIYSCHEKDICPIKNIPYTIYDKIHYVSNPQRKWHNVNHPYFVLPNVVEELKPSACKEEKIAGIVGSIDRNKQTHISIMRALKDGMKKIYLFGKITDMQYYEQKVKPLIKNNVTFRDYLDDKQGMYNEITDVYLSSLSETWSYLPSECKMTGINFHGTKALEGNFEIEMTNEEIIKTWRKELEI
jgi:hypothetical protein